MNGESNRLDFLVDCNDISASAAACGSSIIKVQVASQPIDPSSVNLAASERFRANSITNSITTIVELCFLQKAGDGFFSLTPLRWLQNNTRSLIRANELNKFD